MGKQVYFFGGGRADGNAGMKQLLGGKGANLAEMTAMELPVPPGLTITTDVCNRYLADRRLGDEGIEQLLHALSPPGTDVVRLAGDPAEGKQTIGPHHVTNVGEIAAGGQISMGQLTGAIELGTGDLAGERPWTNWPKPDQGQLASQYVRINPTKRP